MRAFLEFCLLLLAVVVVGGVLRKLYETGDLAHESSLWVVVPVMVIAFALLPVGFKLVDHLLPSSEERKAKLEKEVYRRVKRCEILAQEAFAVAQELGHSVELPDQLRMFFSEALAAEDAEVDHLGTFKFADDLMHIVASARRTFYKSTETILYKYFVAICFRGKEVLSTYHPGEEMYLPGDWEGHSANLKARADYQHAEREKAGRGKHEDDRRRRFGL